MKLNVHQEEFYLDPKNNHVYVNIHEPFYKAGQICGWEGSPLGLGVNQDVLLWAAKRRAKVRVLVGEDASKCYEADPDQWMQFSVQHKCVQRTKPTTGEPLPALYVMQWNKEHFKTVNLIGQQEL